MIRFIRAAFIPVLLSVPVLVAANESRVVSGIGFAITKTIACADAKKSLRAKFSKKDWILTSLGSCDCSQSSATERWGCTIDGTITERDRNT